MSSRLSIFFCASLLTLAACDEERSGDDAGPLLDAGTPPRVDANVPEEDGGAIDGGDVPDGGGGADADLDDDGGASSDGGGRLEDAGPAPDPSPQITLVRGTAAGAISPALPIDGAVVTYVRAAIGEDPAGFFVQGGAMGPALFVTIDPATLSPAPAIGDRVSFAVTETTRVSSQLRVTALEAWTRDASAVSLTPLVQDLSSLADADDADRYESELVTARGTLTGGDASGGPGHRRFRFVTAAVDSADLSLRLPTAVLDAAEIGDGCDVTVGPTPVWRFDTQAQLLADEVSQITIHSCGPPAVLSAIAADPTHVTVRFSRPLDAATVAAGDFTFAAGALVADEAVPVGDTVTVTTTSPMSGGVTYTVIVSGLSDALGTPIGSMNTASFVGIGAGTPSLIFSEYLEGTDELRAIEVSNVGTAAIDLSACDVRLYANGTTTGATHPLPAISLGAGESFVVCHMTWPEAVRLAVCDEVDNTPVSYNGNDALELVCDDTVIDVFGQVGFDPDPAWSSGSVSTRDQTLRRRCGIGLGDPIGSDAFDPAIEWQSFGIDDTSGLGAHCP